MLLLSLTLLGAIMADNVELPSRRDSVTRRPMPENKYCTHARMQMQRRSHRTPTLVECLRVGSPSSLFSIAFFLLDGFLLLGGLPELHHAAQLLCSAALWLLVLIAVQCNFHR